MAFDRARGKVVLFGGVDNSGTYHNDTWTWDGTTWTNVATGIVPRPRGSGGLVFDASRDRLVLFGGEDDDVTGMADTWEWDGAQWQSVATTSSPTPRWSIGMVYDTANQVTVLFGGLESHSRPRLDDTWVYDGADWAQLSPSTQPARRSGHAMAYDASRAQVVVNGGWPGAGGNFDDTWEWDGQNWTQQSPATRPVGLSSHRLDYDSTRQRAVLFGGGASTGLLNETWDYVAPPSASFVAFGVGCAGTAGTPTLSAAPGSLPTAGTTFTFELASLPPSIASVPFGLLGLSKTTWAGLALPVSLASAGAPGCSVYISVDAVVQLANAGNFATWDLPIPNTSVIVGSVFYAESCVLDSGANSLGLTISNAAELTVGL